MKKKKFYIKNLIKSSINNKARKNIIIFLDSYIEILLLIVIMSD